MNIVLYIVSLFLQKIIVVPIYTQIWTSVSHSSQRTFTSTCITLWQIIVETIAMFLAKLELFAILFLSSTLLAATKSDFATTMSPDDLGLKTRKLTHVRVYLHENLTGPFPNVVRVAPDPTVPPSTFSFGAVNIFDDPLLVGPERGSKRVGRAQAVVGFTAQNEFAMLMAVNLVFTEGKYNGSTVTILGRNPVTEKVREMPVVGGTGAFRFATGYVKIRTQSTDTAAGKFVIEYNVYVFHY